MRIVSSALASVRIPATTSRPDAALCDWTTISFAPRAPMLATWLPRRSSASAADCRVIASRSMLRPPLASASACSAAGSLLAALLIANTGTGKASRHGAP